MDYLFSLLQTGIFLPFSKPEDLLPPRITFQRHLRHLFHVHAGKAKLLNDPAFYKINAITTERVLRNRLRKMNRVEKMTVYINKGAEVHPFPFDGSNIFDGHQQSEHADVLPNIGSHVMRQNVAPELRYQQVEIAVGNRKAEQFDLIIHIGYEILLQYR